MVKLNSNNIISILNDGDNISRMYQGSTLSHDEYYCIFDGNTYYPLDVNDSNVNDLEIIFEVDQSVGNVTTNIFGARTNSYTTGNEVFVVNGVLLYRNSSTSWIDGSYTDIFDRKLRLRYINSNYTWYLYDYYTNQLLELKQCPGVGLSIGVNYILGTVMTDGDIDPRKFIGKIYRFTAFASDGSVIANVVAELTLNKGMKDLVNNKVYVSERLQIATSYTPNVKFTNLAGNYQYYGEQVSSVINCAYELIHNGDDNTSSCRLTFSGLTSITIWCEGWGESNCDFLVVGELDTNVSRTSYKYKFDNTQNNVTYTCTPDEHFIEFAYTTDSSIKEDSSYAFIYPTAYVAATGFEEQISTKELPDNGYNHVVNYITINLSYSVDVEDGVYGVDANLNLVNVSDATSGCIGAAVVYTRNGTKYGMMIPKLLSNSGVYRWGNKGTNQQGITDNTFINAIDSSTGSSVNANNAYLPTTFNGSSYNNTYIKIIGDPNYWTTGALSDFNGKSNTENMPNDVSDDSTILFIRTYIELFNTSSSGNSGLTDWYIPSCGQLALLWLFRTEINAVFTKIGGVNFADSYYWSSSEYDADNAWQISFRTSATTGGNVVRWGKHDTYAVMPIRDISTKISTTNVSISGDINGVVVRRIREHSHRVLGKLDSSVMKYVQLDDTNSLLDKYGNEVSLTHDGAHDVFMKLPVFYWKVEETATDIFKIGLAWDYNPGDGWKKWEGDKALLGVYEGYVSDNKLYSNSGVVSTGFLSSDISKQYARNRGEGYITSPWEWHNIMAMLYYCMYGNADSQAVIGKGTNSYTKPTGGTDESGMADTVGGINGDIMSINYWGIDNWWGNKYEWIDNVRITNHNWVVTPMDGSAEREIGIGATEMGCITKMKIGTYFDMTPVSTSSNLSSGYFDSFDVRDSEEVYIPCRSYQDNSDVGGIVYVQDYNNSSLTDYEPCGARLAYYGLIKEVYPLGVYILRTNGKLYKQSEWDVKWNNSAVGIVVATVNTKFVIAPDESPTTLNWGSGLPISNIIYLPNDYTDGVTAHLSDFDGIGNTDKIISLIGTSAEAACFCRNYVFRNGSNGYLGSAGLWKEAYTYKDDIDGCMNIIGGTPINTTTTNWTSNQATSTIALLFKWVDGTTSNPSKTDPRIARPFGEVPADIEFFDSNASGGDDMEQVLSNGVYMMHTNGKVYTKDLWTFGSDLGGVVLKTYKVSIVIAPSSYVVSTVFDSGVTRRNFTVDGVTQIIYIGATQVSGMTSLGVDNLPENYDGLDTTALMVTYNEDNDLSIFSAAQHAYGYVAPNGNRGYLCSDGEAYEIYQNIKAINECLYAGGSTEITGSNYWTSTTNIRDHNHAFSFSFIIGQYYNTPKSEYYTVHPIAKF